MVYEARPGQTFLLGASSWRIEEIGARPRDRHAGAGRRRARSRSGRATASGARRSSGEAIGAFARWAVDQHAEDAASATTTSTRSPPRNLLDFLREQQEATRVHPVATARSSSSASATRSATGGCASCRPYGGRVHAAWGLALTRPHPRRARPRVRRDLVRRRDHRPPARRRRAAGRRARADRARRARGPGRRRAGGSALFGARFRENAGRALLIPRAYPGKRTPLWQQRLKSQTLLEVAKRYAQFPIILETYRECLRDVLDLPGLHDLLAQAAPPRAVARRGRDADRLAVRLLAAVRLRRDVHVRGRHAERRAARGGAVARPRPAARAARPGGAARPDRPGRARRRSRTTSSTAPSARAPTRATRCTTCCAASAT